MTEDLRQVLEIVGQDQASAELRGVIETLVKLERQAKRTGEMLKTATGGDLAKRFDAMKVEAAAFTDGLSKGAGKAVAAMAELRDSMREVEAEQRRIAKPPKVPVPATARPDRALADNADNAGKVTKTVASVGRANGSGATTNAATGRPRPPRDAVRDAGQVWRRRERSEMVERREIEQTSTAWSLAQRRRMGLMTRSEAMEDRIHREGSRNEARLAREARAARAKAERDTFSRVRVGWRMREASETAERQEIERTAEIWNRAQRRRMAVMDRSASVEARRQRETARAEHARGRAESSATDRQIQNVRRAWGIRERSEAAESRHLATVRRERAALRTRVTRSGQHAFSHARHAVSRINHPVFSSPGFWLHAGAAFGVEAGAHILKASEAFDTAMSRLKMFAPQLDAADIRKTALADSVSLGVDASKIVDMIAKSVRDGVPPAIAKSLPKSIVQTAQVMGGDIGRLTDSLAEGIQESTAMGWIKNQKDSRRFLNIEAGLSTTAGNTPEKTEQFIAAGGLGHGKEMGLDLEKTMAYGAMLNASGSRTGQASARFMGQLSQNTPKMVDKYRQAVGSHKNSEEDRAVRSAPQKLGYGGIREMQSKIMAGPEGLIDFATRLQKLDDKARKLVLEGYGFSEQGGAMLAELGSNGGAKGKAVLARAHELAEQKEADDYLSQKFNEWSKSLAFMLSQIEQGWHAIENEIGDVLKSDLVTPFRDWWVQLSTAIVGSNLRDRVHAALMGFIHSLGFDDFRALLDTMTANVGSFDFTGFAKGLGEGIRATVDAIRPLLSMFGGGAGDAETTGRLAAELFGLSISLHAIGPVVAIVSAIASGFLALRAALAGLSTLSELSGLTGALRALVGIEAATAATGLLAMAGALTAIGAAVQGLLSAGVLNPIHLPKDTSKGEADQFLWGKKTDGTSARPAWVDRLFGTGVPGPIMPDVRNGPHGGVLPAFATGGLISGPGGPTSDSIVARVSAGEFVVNADATRRHFGFLSALNEGKLPAFATGGMIGGGRISMPSSAGLGAMSSDAGDAVRRATMGTETGVAAVRGELQGIAALLRMAVESDRPTFGRGSELIHGQVKAADLDDGSASDLYRRMQQLLNTLKLSAYGISDPSQPSGTSRGGGAGAPNLRYGRGGDGGRGGDTPNVRYGRQHGGGNGGGGRYRGTPIPDAPYNGKNIDGLSEVGSKQFAAILGKRESGNRYGIENQYGYVGRWQMGADALAENGYVRRGTTNRGLHNPANWTGKGDVHSVEEFKANKGGVQDTEFGEYTNRHYAQLKAAGVIRDGMKESDVAGWLAAAHLKGVGGAKQLARGHDNRDANGTSASSYQRMMQGVGGPGGPETAPPGGPSVLGASPEAVDPDLTKRLSALNQPRALKDEECVTLAMKAVGITKGAGIVGSNVHDWRKGESADEGNLKPGAAIATFLDRHGREADSYGAGSPGGGGTRGAHLDHAAVFEKYLTDAAGKKIGMQVAEQFKGSGGIRHRNYMFHNGQYGEGNGSAYHAVKTADGKYLGGPNNPLNVQVAKERGANPGPLPLTRTPDGRAPATMAAQVPTRERPRPASDGPLADNASGRGQNVQTADNSTTIMPRSTFTG